MTNKERQKRYRERQKALRGVTDVTELGESVTGSVTEVMDDVTEIACPFGKDKKVWRYACERALRARRYAIAMPEHIRPSDVRFQDPEWQYNDQMRYPVPETVSK